MVQAKRNIQTVIADPPPTSSSVLHHGSLDRRLKAMRNCSSWNNALLNGRRTRGPQWDYATTSYHVSKATPEYYKGVTPLELNPVPSSNPSSALNQYVPGPSSQFSINLQPRAPFNLHALDRHPQQPHTHQHDSDHFSNRSLRHIPQPSQPSIHGRPIGSMGTPAAYPLHSAHLQPMGSHVAMTPQSFHHHPNPPAVPSNYPESKPAMFPAQTAGAVNPTNPVTGSNTLSSPHFQSGVPPSTGHGIPRHMSTTPSLPSSQSENKDTMTSHPASYQNSLSSNHHPAEQPPMSHHMGVLPHSFSSAQHNPPPSSFEKTPRDGMASPTHPQALRSPAPHGMEAQISTSNRKFHAIPSPSLHTLAQRPLTPRSAQALAPAGGSSNPSHQVFQPMYVGYPSSGNAPPPVSISPPTRNLHYTPNQPNLNSNFKLPGAGHQPQVLQVPILASQNALMSEANQFNQLSQFQLQSPALINNPATSTLLSNSNNSNIPSANIGRPMPPNFNPSQFYQPSIIPPSNSSAAHSHPYSNSSTNQ